MVRDSEQIARDHKEQEERERELKDYELEISISTPYDRIDEEMARFYPNICPDPYWCLGADSNNYYEEDEVPEGGYIETEESMQQIAEVGSKANKEWQDHLEQMKKEPWFNELGDLDEHPF
jgi:hypothetical protein